MAPVIAAAALGAASELGAAGINAYSAYQDRVEARNARNKANRQIDEWQGTAEGILNDAMQNNIQLSSPSDLRVYSKLKASFDPSRYVYNFDKFNSSKYNVADYLNPQRDAIMADVAKGIQHTAAGAGLGHSSGAAAAIAQGLIDKDEELYNTAYEQMNNERNFDYGAYTDFINQKQKQLDAMQSGILSKMSMLRDDIMFDQGQQDAFLQNRLNLGNTLAQTRAQLV